MEEAFVRTAMVLGEDALRRLAAARVAVFGLGGVGSYAVEALARAGVGALELVDHDRVSPSNLNRQLYALHSTIGRYKADVASERVLDINPDCRATPRKTFFLPDTAAQFDFTQYDYVVDAIDTVTGKLLLIQCARDAGVPIISAMGTGNKTDPTAFRVSDLFETSGCPLARIMRKECRRRGIDRLQVVWSPEEPLPPLGGKQASAPVDPDGTPRRQKDVPGSVSFVPAAAGLILAGQVIRDLAQFDPKRRT